MIFDDEPKVLQLLQNISYYRLSGIGGTFETFTVYLYLTTVDF